jgi:HEAT repeat protein
MKKILQGLLLLTINGIIILIMETTSWGAAPPIPPWAAKGMCASLTQSSAMDAGVATQALSFPFAVDMIKAAAGVEGCNGLVSSLLELLAHPPKNSHTLPTVIRALSVVKLGTQEPAVVKTVARYLKDKDSQVRAAAAQALGTIGPGEQKPAVITALLESLKEGDKDVIVATAAVLVAIGPGGQKPAVVAALLDRLKKGDEDVLTAAAQALAAVGPDEQRGVIINALIDRLKDGDEDVLAAAAQALGTMELGKQKPAVIAALLNRLKDADGDVRAAAAQAFAIIGPGEQTPAVIGALRDRLKDSDEDVRAATAKALGTMELGRQKPAVIAALLDHLKDTDEDVRAAAAQALVVIGPGEQKPAVVAALLDRLKNGDQHTLIAATKALVVIDPGEQKPAVVAALLDRLKNGDRETLAAATEALAIISPGEQTRSTVAVLLERLKGADENVRAAAAQALATIELGEQKPAVIAALLDKLKDDFAEVRLAAAQALGSLDPSNSVDARATIAVEIFIQRGQAETTAASLLLSTPQSTKAQALALELLNLGELVKQIAPATSFADRQRALVFIISGGTPTALLAGRLGHPTPAPALPTEAEKATPILSAMHVVWVYSNEQKPPLLHEEIATQASSIVRSVCSGGSQAPGPHWFRWFPEEWQAAVALLTGGGPTRCQQASFRKAAEDLQKDLASDRYPGANDIANVLAADARTNPVLTWLIRSGLGLIGYIMLWSVMMLSFPRSRFVQSAIFFSPRLRKLTSFYISEIFPLLPFARRRLLSPFRRQLGPKEELLEAASDENWFPDVEVTEPPSEARRRITDALPAIRGLTVLEGASGLGKTVYLVRLARDLKRIVAFVEAAEENGDVLKAIATRLPAEVMRDSDFLNSLIYAGGLDICIDGLNEVSADVRNNVVTFAKKMSKGNVLVATQPFRWDVPQGRRLLRLRPLRLDQARDFLESREPILPKDLPFRGHQYKKRVREYLDGLSENAPADKTELDARDRALSNPMDLTTIAMIIARGGQPDLLNLQEMAFQQTAIAYENANNGDAFPIRIFAEYVYERRLQPAGASSGRLVLDDQGFARECEILAEHRLLLTVEASSVDGKSVKSWTFRHDKILDFFLYQAIAATDLDVSLREERMLKHIDDPRFRGVFLLAALRAPLEYATWLRERIADRAAETRDPLLLYQVWDTVRQRVDAKSTIEQAKAA